MLQALCTILVLPLFSADAFSLEDPHRKGVYCDWKGWLYNSEERYRKHSGEHYHHWFDTKGGDESFTFINVYCHKDKMGSKTVRYFAKAVRGDLTHKDLKHPFQHRDGLIVVKDDNDLPSIRCDWTGWLFWDRTKDNYDKYFDIEDKGWVNGRVMNPFCSYNKEIGIGIVTALRVYCFDCGGNDRCYDLEEYAENE